MHFDFLGIPAHYSPPDAPLTLLDTSDQQAGSSASSGFVLIERNSQLVAFINASFFRFWDRATVAKTESIALLDYVLDLADVTEIGCASADSNFFNFSIFS